MFAGVDGCPGGWFGVAHRTGGVDMHRAECLADLCAHFADIHQIFIDIPLGLPSSEPRQADALARRVLRGQSSSVFPVPCRAAVRAGSWEEASAINASVLGRRLSKQTWNICRKIREADELGEVRLREAHPEIAFRSLAGAPLAGKKTAEGRATRLALLPSVFQDLYERAVADWPRRLLARDDILDACALALVAPDMTATLPSPPECDALGRPMAIWVPPGVVPP